VITAYHRPQNLKEALQLIGRPSPRTLPLGGGTILSKPGADAVEVVDLQALGLNQINRNGNELELGAVVSLQDLLEGASSPQALKTALKLEAPLNLRNAATIAGTLVVADGRSSFTTALLALDARLELASGTSASTPASQKPPKPGREAARTADLRTRKQNLGEFLPLRASQHGTLITRITIPMNVGLAFEYVSRTPADKPIVCAALAQWPSGRTRLALGGYGSSPLLALDGSEAGGLEAAARNAFHEAGDDWASAEYRMAMGALLAKRCLEQLPPRGAIR